MHTSPTTLPVQMVDLYLALAEHGRGHTAEAKKLLKETADWMDQPQPDNQGRKNMAILQWTERVQLEQLRRELEGLLK